MKRNIIIAKNALSADLCNTIIDRAKHGFKRAYTGEKDKPNSIRRSQVSWLTGIVKHLDIYIPVMELIHKVNSEFYHFDLEDPEPFQITSPEHYEGGTFQFPDDQDKFIVEDSIEQGTAIFFPSYMQHGVVPVTKGIRYSLVCWVLGSNFK